MDEFHHGNHISWDAMADRLHAVARLALGLSHELNNAFGAMQSNVDIMRRHLPADSPLHTNLNHIQHATGHALELSQILQIYTQRARTVVDTVNLPPLMARAVKTFKSAASEGFKVRMRPFRGDLLVSTCPVLLEQAVGAILQNAVDALQDTSGAVAVETAIGFDRVRPGEGLLFGTLPTDDGALVEISDTGEGMTPEVLQHILEPFFSTRIRARGLGLAPVVGLVFHCNAAVQIISSPGRGTTVRLLFPDA